MSKGELETAYLGSRVNAHDISDQVFIQRRAKSNSANAHYPQF